MVDDGCVLTDSAEKPSRRAGVVGIMPQDMKDSSRLFAVFAAALSRAFYKASPHPVQSSKGRL